MHRYELSDQQWARIEPLLPDRFHHGEAGHPFNDHRPIVNAILWILHTGAPWRDLPERYGPWETVYSASTAGARTAPGTASSPPCSTSWTTRARSTTTCGASTAPSSAPAGPPPGRG